MGNQAQQQWRICPTCKQLMFMGAKHRCPEQVTAKIDVELDMIIEEEMSTWNQEVKKFWDSKEVIFYEWLLANKRY